MKIGDQVLYVCEFDADTSYSPNVGPATVTKVNADGTLDLFVLFMNGQFWKTVVKHGDEVTRGTWHER